MQSLKLISIVVMLAFIAVASAGPLRTIVLAVHRPHHYSSNNNDENEQPFNAGVIDISTQSKAATVVKALNP
jgi:hypothetical protein